MKNQIILLFLIILSIFGVFTLYQLNKTNLTPDSNPLSVFKAFPNVSFQNPVDFQTTTANMSLIYVVEQQGIIKSFYNSANTSSTTTILDIRSKVISGGERGLLGLAFHPDFITNGLAYVDYTAQPDGRTVISQFRYINGTFNESSEVIILEIAQPYANHNAGQIMFGIDGYLYITLGDGGSGGDPHGNGQNKSSLLGSILRIDVNHFSPGLNYSIPKDNPFINNSLGFRKEIFAYGLRNPWRISQDSETGLIWAGDVGQNSREEVDIIKSGFNYGWNIMEGYSCYNPPSNCNTSNLLMPVIDYSHDQGNAITGGYVYRGSIAQLYGHYIFGDYGSGKIWLLNSKNNYLLIKDTGFLISSFGIDLAKQLYFFDYSSGYIYSFEISDYSLNLSSPSINQIINLPQSMNSSNTIPRFSAIFEVSSLYIMKNKLRF